MANLPEDKKWTGVYQWETSDRALGGPDSQFTKPVRDLTNRTAYLKEEIEKGNKSLSDHAKSTNHPDASTTQKGFVQLSSVVTSDSEKTAATSKAVKQVYDLVTGYDNRYSAANHNHHFNELTSIPFATTSKVGIVKLNNTVNSTSTTEGATANAVKQAYDLAAKKITLSDADDRYLKIKDFPAGIPQPWPSATAPDGWFKCDGSSFDINRYPQLAKAYPSGVLPDLRGEFIRGWDAGRGVDVGRGVLSTQAPSVIGGLCDDNDVGNDVGFLRGSISRYSVDRLIHSEYDLLGAYHIDFNLVQNIYTPGNPPVFGEGVHNLASGFFGGARVRNIAFLYIVRAA